MQRLLMGEVGSGKTVVALFALLRAVEQGWQGALMAPTETLAEQHFATIQALMPGEAVPAALLTGSTTAARRADILGKLATGELSLVVGTHALIEPDVRFARLAVAVVDEQHRFGVRQRAALDAKGPEDLTPHVLHMTATPIPRTLALVEHGDLDHTVLQRAAARPPADRDARRERRARARAGLRAHPRGAARRAARRSSSARSWRSPRRCRRRRRAPSSSACATREFSDFRVVLMHGQLRPREKQEAMAAFAAGGADVLVATSVIEVGIDVPNATVMLVEDAERYGISPAAPAARARSAAASTPRCACCSAPKDSARLKALAAHRDGFRAGADRPRAAQRGRADRRRASTACAQFRVAQLPDDADAARARARRAPRRSSTPTRSSREPEHALLAQALAAAYGAEALGADPGMRIVAGTLRRPPPDGAARATRRARRATACARRCSSDPRPARRRARARPVRRLRRARARGALARRRARHVRRLARRPRSRRSRANVAALGLARRAG